MTKAIIAVTIHFDARAQRRVIVTRSPVPYVTGHLTRSVYERPTQSSLTRLCSRLILVPVKSVTVYSDGWTLHTNHFHADKERRR